MGRVAGPSWFLSQMLPPIIAKNRFNYPTVGDSGDLRKFTKIHLDSHEAAGVVCGPAVGWRS